MGFLDKVKNLFVEEEEEPIKSEVIQVEIPSPVKEELEDDAIDNDTVNSIKVEEKPAAPIFFDDDYFKELDQPKKEVKFSQVKEASKPKDERKPFKPTPIISPVYGVLDKNYNKEDITTKQKIERTNTVITIDEVRKKAYGTLEDELENTLFSSSSILFNDVNDEKEEIKEDLFDELIELDDDINIVEDELSKTIDNKLDESELFDLIDSIYEKGE